MKKLTCSFCDSRSSLGYLFDRPALRICRDCRFIVLSYLTHIGVPLTDQNPFINELCVESAIVEADWYGFFNCITGTGGRVIQLTRKEKRK